MTNSSHNLTLAGLSGQMPLSYAQQRLWFINRLEGGKSTEYNMPVALLLRGELDLEALTKTINTIVARHASLRTHFADIEGKAVQVIESEVGVDVPVEDLSGMQEEVRQGHVDRHLQAEVIEPFDLSHGPLVRMKLLKLGDQNHILLRTVHHIVSDEWSEGVFNQEFGILYEAYREKRENPLEPLAVQYADYALWQRDWLQTGKLDEGLRYWKEQLAGAPALLELPTDHARPAEKDYAGAFARLELDARLTSGLKELSRRHGMTMYMTLLAGWVVLLARLSGQQDVVVGTPVANRQRAEVEGLIGFFVNTLALRLDVSGSPTVGELLEQVKGRALAAQEHQDIPFEQVVELVRPVRSLAHSPLFQVMFAWQNAPGGSLELPGLEVKPFRSSSRVMAKFDLTLTLQEAGQGIVGGIEYATSLFEPATIERYLAYFRMLLEAMVADEAQAVDRLPMLPAAERRQVLYEWNDTRTDFPSDKCIHELFEEQVGKSPTATAVVFEEASLTYRELNRRANQLAHYLRELGVKPDSRVAICAERGLEMVVGLLAILKAGGAYVPLDPGYPVERLRFMLEDSTPMVLLTQAYLRELFPDFTMPVLDLDDAAAPWSDRPESNLDPASVGLTSAHLAYVIYTSGSTGVPKGVMVEHANITNYLFWADDTYYHSAGFGSPVNHSIGFDGIVTTFFGPIVSGQTLMLLRQGTEMESLAYRGSFGVDPFTLVKVTPSHLKLLNVAIALDEIKPLTRTLMIGGEALVLSDVLFWQRRFPDVRLVNHFGPTETTVGCCTFEISTPITSVFSIPIGRPIANAQVYILDGCGEPVPVGVAGELYIGGAGVARGYLNRAELTAERFLRDPFVTDAGARMYRTGDVGRWLPDGNIEFLGRNDDQVKIRGYRIELGEIEARLSEHSGVREAVVIAREDTPGDKRLVAYYTGAAAEELGAEALRAHLSGTLPEYMVPAAYVGLDHLPLTPNGKLDRKALPAPGGDAYATRGYEPPQGEIETKLAQIWMEVLKLDRVGRHDNFFELGGHSLLAVRLLTRIQQTLSVQVGIRDLFVHAVLSDFARELEGAAPAVLPAIMSAERSGHLPLSFAQQRLWFLAQMEGVSEAYHIPFSLRLGGTLDRVVLRRVLDRIVTRHEALRTTFAMVAGEAVQQIASTEESRFHLLEYDLRPRSDASSELERLVVEEASTSFDLERGPLIRGRLIRLAEDEHVLLITMHHIVSDGWSMGVLLNELTALYGAYLRGEADPLPVLEIQYADYAVWQRQWIDGEILQQQAEYWKTSLAGAPALLELPTDHARPAEKDYAGAFARLELDARLTSGLKELSRRHGMTMYMTLLAGWVVLLARLSGQQDVVVGTPVANRQRAEVEGLIGFFVNTLALRLDVSGSPTVGELLEQVKGRALAAQEHQDIPFEQVVELVRPVRSLAHSPLFQVMFAWQNAPGGSLELPGLEVKPFRSSSRVMAKFDLTLTLQEAGQGIVGGIEYATSLFEPATIERYLAYFRMLLEAMVADEAQAVDRLQMLPAAERRQVLYEWNDTRTDFPSDKCIHELFEEQVGKSPTATAVVFEEASLTYRELNRRANQLAHYLRELGVKPDSRVAICAERGLEMVVGLLAILKAGGAYVPLDPGYPVERLRFMLEDSTPMVLLTQAYLRELFPDFTMPVLDLDDAAAPWSDRPESNLDPASVGLTSAHLAYVIYTSGSTGVPKGVMVEHANITRLFAITNAWFQFDASDVWTLFHSYAFDFSVWEIFGALLYGGSLMVVPGYLTRAPEDFYSLLCQTKVTVLNQTPSAFRQLITAQANSEESHRLRYVIFGGEALEVATLRPWYEQNLAAKTQLINMYGLTETTVHATYRTLKQADISKRVGSPIGCRIPDLRTYILDGCGEPVPVGVAGELYIGGAGVARGYLNRAELTAERFLRDPFVTDAGARMYRTGDVGRWLPDGNIEFLGRNDDQVKIRGYRIELGEIEARLSEHPGVREAVVIAREDTPGDKRLVAYYTGAAAEELGAEALRAHLSGTLPEYMVPAAIVFLDHLPLTPNGKLDRKALPAPGGDAYATRGYEPPQGEIETKLAQIWMEVLKLGRVGRHDNFFELGGHSLLAIAVIERMRRSGLQVDVRALFATPELADLAAAVGFYGGLFEVPANRISLGGDAITPEMLPLVQLEQEEIDRIVRQLPGGARNVQDIYPLAPLQEGILFHHLLGGEGDPYLLAHLMSFDSRERLDGYLGAVQAVIDRHDILRTAVVWEGLPEPVQVVWRKAILPVEEEVLDPGVGDAAERLYARFDPRRYRFDVRHAPLLRCYVAYDRAHDRWLMMQLLHHLAGDHSTLEVMREEIEAHLLGKAGRLSEPLPFRNLVAQARLGVSREEHERFFRKMLGDVEEPTAPFGMLDVHGDGRGIEEARIGLDSALARQIRERSRKLGVSAASVCHVAWAQVLAKVSGRRDVVFGTVLFGRMQGGEGADRVMGLFINTLPVRLEVGEEGIEVSVRRMHAQLAELLHHEHASLALAQRCSAVPAPAPLFSALLNYRHSSAAGRPRSEEARQAWSGIEALRGEERTNYPLTLSVDDVGEDFVLTVQTVTSIGPKRVCEFMQTALEELVKALEKEPERAVRTLEVLPAAERRQVLYEWNDTRTDFPSDKCIHELFEEQVGKSPTATAVVFEEASLTYRELNRRANQLAHYLRELGVKPDSRVAICVERGLEMVVGLLAILKAGGAYVPLDPGYPVERLRFMLEDSTPMVLLTQAYLRELFPDFTMPVLDLDDAAAPWSDRPESNLDPASVGLTSAHLAYVIYTSGSTGVPKGVMNEHRGLVNRLTWMQQAYEMEPQDAVLQKTAFSFDVSVWEFFWPLFIGGKLVMAQSDGHKDPAYLVDTIKRYSITTIHFVPSMLRLFLDIADVTKCSSLRRVICSGEALNAAVARRFQERLPDTKLNNLYGPTEAAIDVTAWSCPPEIAQDSIPIGRPIANAQVYILDGCGEPVPVGVAGELYIGGAGVARGYLNRAELTAERFLRDPFVTDAGARMYRTGDVGRWLPDGNIEFLGRNDDQVKIRGYRIELGEIEARLSEHPGVREAVVIAREDTPGDKRLVAYYTGAAAEELGAEALRAHLSGTLPEYMVPAAYVGLDHLPLTPNGKLDRKALPAPGGDAYATRGYEPPQGEIETKLAQIWMEVLKLGRVGRHDNFFELGGHSLLAIAVIERMRRSGLQVDVRALFATPELADLAAAVGFYGGLFEVPANRISLGGDAITPEMLPLVQLEQEEIDRIVRQLPGGARNVQDIYPLAPLQEGILFHHLLGGEGDPYLLAHLMSFDSRERLDGYLGAVQAVIDRHDILRTAVVWEGLPEPVQVVWRKAILPVEEEVLDPGVGDAAERLYARFDPRRYRFDVRHAPLLRCYVAYDRAHDRWLMMQLLHHLAGDHSTLEVMREEIEAHLLGKAGRLSEPLPFRNLVAQARLGVSREEHERFFRKMLGDVEEPTAPFGMLDVHGDGRGIEEARIGLDSALARQIRERSRKLGVSAASVCHVAWAQVLAKVSGRRDVVFGTVLFGRMQGGEGADRVMGLFINTLPVRLEVGEEGIEVSVRRMHAQLAELLHHEHASLALAQRCSAVPAPAPLFSALLNYRHSSAAGRPRSEEARQAWSGIEALRGEERTNYPLTLSVDDVGEDFVLTVQTVTSIGPKRVCEFMQTALEELVKALEKEPERAVRTLEVLPAAERRQVLYEWNDTRTDFPSDKCIHELFEEQVGKSPTATAVVFEEASLTYRELNRRANQLAHYLRELGVKPDSRVAICVERGLEMVVGLLAILKAGGAYVPLDPGYPVERLRFMLEDSTPMVLLTQAYLRELFPDFTMPVLDLDDAAAPWSDRPESNLDPASVGLTSAHLAYVIYTSGSTGVPKGVMVSHQNLMSSTHARKLAYGELGRFLLLSPISFDSSVAGIFGTLTNAGTLLIAARDVVLEPSSLKNDIQRFQVESLLCIPSLYQKLLEYSFVHTPEHQLLRVIVAGEPCPPGLVAMSAQSTPQTLMFNEYGPTEVTIWASMHRCVRPSARQSIPIGRPIANAQVYILDGCGEPVPVGVAGELYIGGAGVARGYLNRAELTAERFLRDPFVTDAGARMYRTGDVGRWLPDGNIEFLGRNDDQVKIRGYRIELGEIEARLSEHPGVREAVVVAREDTPGDKRLVAYYTGAAAEELGAEALRAHLSGTLPEYMVPAAYVGLDHLPLTPNGKLDRKALPAPGGDAYATRGYEPPQGEIETKLAQIWMEVLKLDRVGRHDNFFELGGHSLLAVRLLTRIQQTLSVQVGIRDLFVHAVLSDLTAQVIDLQLKAFDQADLISLLKIQYPEKKPV